MLNGPASGGGGLGLRRTRGLSLVLRLWKPQVIKAGFLGLVEPS